MPSWAIALLSALAGSILGGAGSAFGFFVWTKVEVAVLKTKVAALEEADLPGCIQDIKAALARIEGRLEGKK